MDAMSLIALALAKKGGSGGGGGGSSTGVEQVVISTSGAVTQELQPNKVYVFTGDLTSLTITLGTPIDDIANIYQVFFANGATPVTLTLPASVDVGDFVPEADMLSEINIQYGGGLEGGSLKNRLYFGKGENW